MSGIKALAGQTLIYGLGTIVPRMLNYLLLTPFYTRVFLKGEYGSVTILYTYVAFLLVILSYGMETTFFRFSESEKHPDKVFTTASLSLILTTLPFILIVLLFNTHLAYWLDYQENPNYITWLGLIVSFDILFSIPFAKLRRENKAVWFTTVKLINIAINIGLNFFFLWFLLGAYKSDATSFWGSLYNPQIGVGYVLIANLTASFVTGLLLMPQYLKVKWVFDKALWLRMIRYALPLLVVGVAAMINEVADKLLLKELFPNPDRAMDEVGIYAANYKIAVLMTIFIQMFKYAAEPFFFQKAKDKNAPETYASVMKYFIIFGLSIFLGVTLFIDQAKLFIGQEFRSGLNVVPIVLLANLFLGIYYNLSVWYKLTNKTHLGAVISIIGAALTIVINILFIPRYGYLAAAWATFAAYGSMMLISWLWGQRHYKINYPALQILFYFAFALSIYWGFQYLEVTSQILQIGVSGLMLMLFVATAYFVERKELKQGL